MKKLQLLALILACVLLFSSCAGIGDGALIKVDPRDTQSHDESTGGADDTQLDYIKLEPIYSIDEDILAMELETKCAFTMCSFTGDVQAEMVFDGVEGYNLFSMVYSSNRERITESADKNQNYLDVDFYYDINGEITKRGKFRVYANDYVDVTEEGVSTRISSSILSGYTEGIYQNVLSYASASIKPDKGVLITINPKPEGHDLSVEDAAEIYKLLMTAESQAHDEPVIPTTSMETIQVIFNTEYGRAAFYVNKDDAVGYYEGFLEGEHDIYFKIEGIHKKLMDYIK